MYQRILVPVDWKSHVQFRTMGSDQTGQAYRGYPAGSACYRRGDFPYERRGLRVGRREMESNGSNTHLQ
jgi:hypothetical protein